jgi:hypothetical protein
MGFRNTYRPKVGPFTFNFDKRFGLSSATIRLFGVTYRLWSKRQESGIASVDIAGPYSYRPKAKKKEPRNSSTHSNNDDE